MDFADLLMGSSEACMLPQRLDEVGWTALTEVLLTYEFEGAEKYRMNAGEDRAHICLLGCNNKHIPREHHIGVHAPHTYGTKVVHGLHVLYVLVTRLVGVRGCRRPQ